MYYPIENGSVESIYGYKCHIAEPGYGKNVITGELEYVGIIQSSNKSSEQMWVRTPLPKDWVKSVKKEEDKQRENEDYIDDNLEGFRRQEWKRRLCGVWVMVHGKPTYITGLHYYYLNWVQIDIGSPYYRDSDRKIFYVWRYCEEDPECGGLLHAARRREGKTFKGGAMLLEYISRTANANSGIQSKTAADAKAVFQKAVVNVFKKMPDFFRPVFDASKGVTPTSELRFSKTTVKGKRALDYLDDPELDSFIDWKSSEIFSMDGRKEMRHFEDEVGKTQEVDVYKRWQVNRFCLDQDGVWVGKAWASTTVEEMQNGGAAFREWWDASNPNEKDKNGRTKSGLYRLFLPAHETTFFDKYGMPLVDKAVEYYNNQREGLRSDPRALSSIIRKNPMTEEEMFRIDGDTCHFNAMKLNEQRDILAWNKDFTERVNLEWEGGVPDSKVVINKNEYGRWEIVRGFRPNPEEVNNTIKRGSSFYPVNNFRYGCGVDPYDHDDTEDSRQSKAASLVKQKHNRHNHEDPLNGAYIIKYHARPNTASLMWEDMVKMAFYFSCEILVENQKPGMLRYFKDRGYQSFLMLLPGRKEYGIPSTPENKEAAMYMVEDVIENHINKIFFMQLIDDLLLFDVKKTGKFDVAMAALWTEVACVSKYIRQSTTKLKDITEYLRQTKVPKSA